MPCDGWPRHVVARHRIRVRGLGQLAEVDPLDNLVVYAEDDGPHAELRAYLKERRLV
ncbi:hypothetical protein GCM10027418_21150 [Mariniluteicoccus endophyticus]